MPQAFTPGMVLLAKLAVAGGGLAAAWAAMTGLAWSPYAPAVDEVLAQPIPFSHKHHVGDVGLDCRFCHATVERSATPGMPSAQACLGCHSQLFADQALLAPLHRALEQHQPIAWKQATHLPDYVYFDHSVHVAKGVACIECHGRVDQMALMRRPQDMTMKWCFACHQNPAPQLRFADDVFGMPPRALAVEEAALLQRLAQHPLESERRLTDCSTCHR